MNAVIKGIAIWIFIGVATTLYLNILNSPHANDHFYYIILFWPLYWIAG